MNRSMCFGVAMIAVLLGATGCASSGKQSTPPDPVQEYVDALRADLSGGKVQVFSGVMKLDAAQGNVFWPIYQDYETELFELGDRRMGTIRQFVVAQHSGTLDGAQAQELADAFFSSESERLELLKKYHGILSSELSPLSAAQFVQVEHRIATVIDLLIASQLPLVEAAPRPVAAAASRP